MLRKVTMEGGLVSMREETLTSKIASLPAISQVERVVVFGYPGR